MRDTIRPAGIVRTAFLAAWLFWGTAPEALADGGRLEGTPETSAGVTIFKAKVNPGETYNDVFGVIADSTNSSYFGQVTIDQGTVTGTVYGNRAISGDDLTTGSCNKVTITNSSVGTVYGGYAYGGSKNASVHQNTVEITGGSVSMYVYGGSADGSTLSVTGNKVILNHVTVNKTVYGGCAFNTSSWLSMLRNSVTITGGTVKGSVYGGYASGSATASNSNTVTIDGGAVINGSVYGGYALSSNSDAKNNLVFIKDGTLKNHIYGGVGRNAYGNTIVLYGGDLSQADIFGYSDGRKSHSENTLEVWGSNISIKSAQNFENYYFIVPAGMANQADRYMLKVGTPVNFYKNLSGTNVGIAMQNGTTLSVGDKINLIDKTEGTPNLVSLAGKELKGGTLFTNYGFTLSSTGENGTLVATATSGPIVEDPTLLGLGGTGGSRQPAGRAIPEAKSVVEAQVASVALLSEGSEQLSGLAMTDAKNAAAEAENTGRDAASFLTVGGGRIRYKTGSHVDVSSTHFTAGLAKQFTGAHICMLAAAFFETGYGDYSTHNSFTRKKIRGDGNAHYEGGGLMLHLEQAPEKGLYVQAIGHMGNVHNSWKTDDLYERISYDTRQFYCSAGTTFGLKGEFKENFGFDVYGKIFLMHQKGDKANLNGEHFAFQSVDFRKNRFGTRVNYNGFQSLRPFVGIAWEKEYDGKAAATVNGCKINEPELKGENWLLECGLRYTPADCCHVDFAFTGYNGNRHGINGQTSFVWNF